MEKVRPIISEKTANQIQEEKYNFYVTKGLNKIEIKKFIEKKYGVRVDTVNTQNVKGKPRRRGMIKGYTADKKKAVVTLAKGETIDKIKGMY